MHSVEQVVIHLLLVVMGELIAPGIWQNMAHTEQLTLTQTKFYI